MTPRQSFVAGAVAGALACLMSVFSACAHVQTVATKCEGAVTPALVADVGTALGADDYEAAIAKATIGVLPCLVLATVQEIVTSLDDNSTVKAALAIHPEVVRQHGHQWLATHGGGHP